MASLRCEARGGFLSALIYPWSTKTKKKKVEKLG